MAPGPEVPTKSAAATAAGGSTTAELPESVFPNIPPFPSDVPTCPLLRVSLARLLAGDAAEEDRLWRACCEVGFFYLDLRANNARWDDDEEDEGGDGGPVGNVTMREVHVDGEQLLEDADKLFEVQKQLFELPVEEKVRYDLSSEGSYFGYKGYGAGVVDKEGHTDRNEFYNVSKDDILSLSPPLPAPALLTPHRPLLSSFIRQSHSVVTLLLRILDARLGLAPGTLPALHRLSARSGDQTRFIRAPPQPRDDARVALGEHTDFGSVTVLFNRVGGLQVLLPAGMRPEGGEALEEGTGSGGGGVAGETWAYVRPLRDHAIVNLGDALVKMTSGILRSNIHRVAPPPGAQAAATRYSLVYFARPEDDVVLRVLDGSASIEEKAREAGAGVGGSGGNGKEAEMSAKEWILRRALGRRTGGNWEDSQGTEEVSRRRGQVAA